MSATCAARVIVFLGVLIGAVAFAQEAPAARVPAPPVAAPPAAAAATAPAPAAPAITPPPVAAPPASEAPERFREQTIYVPYEDLRKTFEKTGRGVFIPYDEFQALWQAARRAVARPPEVKAPVDSLISEITGEATVSKDVLTVQAKVRIELIREGWNQVPIRLGDVAISEAMLGDRPARLVTIEGGYALLAEHRGKTPEVVELSLEFAKAYTKSPGRNTVSFEAPAAPVSRWDIRIPEPGVKVDVYPLVAATEVPAAKGVAETHVRAFVGAAPTVRVEWTPKAEGARGLTVLAAVGADLQVSVDEGVTRTRVELDYAVSRAELPQVRIEVPSDQKIVNVYDPNVREWSVASTAGSQCVTAQLFEPAREKQHLVLELERFSADQEVAVPVVTALDVGRQQGTVVIRVAGGLRAEAQKREGLRQLDAAELPAQLAAQTWDFAYRYAALPFALVLRVEKIQPRIVAETLVEVHVQPEQLVADVLTVADVQRAGVFQLSFVVPPEWEVRQVRGEKIGTGGPAEIDAHHRAADQPGTLIVDLARQARGPAGVALQLFRRLHEPDLLTPTGHAVTIPLPLPHADPASILRENGRIVLYGPDSLRFNPRDTKGLRSVPQAEAVQDFPSTQREGTERPVMAFAFGADPVTLSLDAERRKPHITVGQLLVVRIESGVARFEATFHATVLYSGVKSLRVDLPAEVADQVRVTASGIRHQVIENPAELGDLAAGMVAWRLSGETEFLGKVAIPMVWEPKLAKLDVGGSVDLPVPRLIPRGVDRAWGQIVLAKAESIDVTPTETRSGLRAIDPQHDLMPGATVREAARAYEFHDDWSLVVRATRYEAKDVKATSIERALITGVVTRGDVTSVQAVYAMRSARQRLTVQLPGEVAFDTQPLHINGRPVPLEQGAGREYFIPLTGQAQNTPFLVELRYTVRGQGLRFECPSFPEEPAVQRVYLSLFLPHELSYLGSRGPWNGELVWAIRGFSSWPRGNLSQSALYGWVAGDVSQGRENLASFTTDGRHVLFSTLRPGSGPAGALRLSAVRDVWLQLVVVGLGVAIGLALLRATFTRRALVIGMIITLMLLLAVFLPSLARALVTNAAVAGAMVVLVIWCLWYLVVVRPRDPLVQARQREREEAGRRLAKARLEAAAAATTTPPPVPHPPAAPRPPQTPSTPADSGGPGSGKNPA